MKLWLERIWPTLHVHCVHSDSNLFRYDDNIEFVQRQLIPLLEDLRDRSLLLRPEVQEKGRRVSKREGNWRDHMRVTLAYADGSSARVSAINAAVRCYRYGFVRCQVVCMFRVRYGSVRFVS